jgi:hypothetical protein
MNKSKSNINVMKVMVTVSFVGSEKSFGEVNKGRSNSGFLRFVFMKMANFTSGSGQ